MHIFIVLNNSCQYERAFSTKEKADTFKKEKEDELRARGCTGFFMVLNKEVDKD